MKWHSKTLGEICKIHGGNPSPKAEEFDIDGIPFVKMKDLGAYHHARSLVITENRVSQDTINRKRLKVIPKGSIVLPRSGSVGLNHRGILAQDSVIVSHICALEVYKPEVLHNAYLYYYLTSINMVNITKQTTGLDAITFEDLSKIKIPLPPLHVQEHIADILDEADTLRKKDAEILKKYDELLQSIFYDMFGDPVKNEKGWEVKKLGEVCEKIQTGPFGSLLHVEDYDANGIPLINPMHIVDRKIQPDKNYAVNTEKAKELTTYFLKKGDVVMARRGEMGRCGLVEEEHAGLVCGTGSLIIRPINLGYSVYLYYVLSSEKMRIELENVAQGVTMKNLNQTIIKNLDVAMPPDYLCEQLYYVHETIYLQKAIVKDSLDQSEALFQSLMQRAFKGELVG